VHVVSQRARVLRLCRTGQSTRVWRGCRVALLLSERSRRPVPSAFRSSIEVLQIDGCFYHFTPAFHVVRVATNSKVPSLHPHYRTSSLLRTPPPPSRLSTDFPVSPVIRFPSPPISRRGEEDFSSCLAHPCHRAAAATPPECLVASVSLRRAMLPSPHEERLGLWGFRFEATYAFTRCGPMTRSPSFRWLRR
jgi:hypothetical protein